MNAPPLPDVDPAPDPFPRPWQTIAEPPYLGQLATAWWNVEIPASTYARSSPAPAYVAPPPRYAAPLPAVSSFPLLPSSGGRSAVADDFSIRDALDAGDKIASRVLDFVKVDNVNERALAQLRAQERVDQAAIRAGTTPTFGGGTGLSSALSSAMPLAVLAVVGLVALSLFRGRR